MKPTADELAAAQRLGDAFLAFALAVNQGSALRAAAARPTERQAALVPAPPPRSPEPRPKGLVGIREAAEYLSVCDKTLYHLTVPRGPLPSVRIGSSVRYTLTDLNALIERKRQTPG